MAAEPSCGSAARGRRHWLDGYLKRLDAPPARRTGSPARPGATRSASAARRRLGGIPPRPAGARALARRLARWWPRLLPGAAAARRTESSAPPMRRSLAAAEATAEHGQRRDELAGRSLLGSQLRGAPRHRAPQRDPGRGRRDPRSPGARRAGPGAPDHGRLKDGIPRLPGLGPAVAALRPPPTPRTTCATWPASSTRVFLSYGRRQPIRVCTRHRPRSPPTRRCRCSPVSWPAPPTTPCGR